jgi:hypothetical protein
MDRVRIGIGVSDAWARAVHAVRPYLLARGLACELVEGVEPHGAAVLAGAALANWTAAGDGFELLAAPVALGARYKSRTIAFHDLVVHRDRPWLSLGDVVRARIAWDERDPLLPHVRSLVARLAGCGDESAMRVSALDECEALGSVARGDADLAVVDSLAVEHWRRAEPALASSVRVLQSLGPQTGPAWVASRHVPLAQRRSLRRALLDMHLDAAGRRALADAALSRFVGVHPTVSGPVRLKSGFREVARSDAGDRTA